MKTLSTVLEITMQKRRSFGLKEKMKEGTKDDQVRGMD